MEFVICNLITFFVLLHELLDSSLGIDELLLAGKERVAVGADLHMDVRFGRARVDRIATGADDGRVDILGM